MVEGGGARVSDVNMWAVIGFSAQNKYVWMQGL